MYQYPYKESKERDEKIRVKENKIIYKRKGTSVFKHYRIINNSTIIFGDFNISQSIINRTHELKNQ